MSRSSKMSVWSQSTTCHCVSDRESPSGLPSLTYTQAAEAETSESGPTQEDIARIIHIIKDRDAELRLLKEEILRISEENRKLREDILPMVKAAKDRSQPLPEEPSAPASDSKGGLSRK